MIGTIIMCTKLIKTKEKEYIIPWRGWVGIIYLLLIILFWLSIS